MNDPENFFSRWSRKKSEEQRESPKQSPPAAASPAAAPPPGERLKDPIGEDTARAPDKVVEFDLSSLPSIDSIGPQTDVSVFMQPGVPSELRYAALRRAWSVDPAIRDFRGLQENDWDFNDPNGIPGFGPLTPDIDVKKMIAELFGEKPRGDSIPPSEPDMQVGQLADESKNPDLAAKVEKPPAPATNAGSATPAEADPLTSRITSPQEKFVHREGSGAPQNNDRGKTESKRHKPRRTDGGGLPQ